MSIVMGVLSYDINSAEAQGILALTARAEKAEAEVERLRGLHHAELIATMHYCERHEMGFMSGLETNAPCPHCECERLEARVAELETALRDIRERSTWDEDVHDREATEDDMVNALIAIFDRTQVLFEATEPGGAASKEERNA